MSALTHLECSFCEKEYEADELHTVCPACGKPLLARYDLKRVREEWSREDLTVRVASLWRYQEVLPVRT